MRYRKWRSGWQAAVAGSGYFAGVVDGNEFVNMPFGLIDEFF
jgi:hypothetical protein